MLERAPRVRHLQTAIHPRKGLRLLRLSDQSTVTVSTLSPPSPALPFAVSRLNLDSTNHPSWNPALSDRLLLDDRGQVARFRQRFAAGGDTGPAGAEFSSFAEMDPSLLDSAPPPTVPGKSKPRPAKPARK